MRLVLGVPVEVERGAGVHRRQDHAGGSGVFGGIRALVGMPEAWSREVIVEAGVEDYLGQKAVSSLAAKRWFISFTARSW